MGSACVTIRWCLEKNNAKKYEKINRENYLANFAVRKWKRRPRQWRLFLFLFFCSMLFILTFHHLFWKSPTVQKRLSPMNIIIIKNNVCTSPSIRNFATSINSNANMNNIYIVNRLSICFISFRGRCGITFDSKSFFFWLPHTDMLHKCNLSSVMKIRISRQGIISKYLRFHFDKEAKDIRVRKKKYYSKDVKNKCNLEHFQFTCGLELTAWKTLIEFGLFFCWIIHTEVEHSLLFFDMLHISFFTGHFNQPYA